ncbi:hypothetical protein IW262DRAFT_1478859 [Armillaria fumosa]|nr:hypothetical protein IW262DRAFT_1478859 [Armillaria fumosa]
MATHVSSHDSEGCQPSFHVLPALRSGTGVFEKNQSWLSGFVTRDREHWTVQGLLRYLDQPKAQYLCVKAPCSNCITVLVNLMPHGNREPTYDLLNASQESRQLLTTDPEAIFPSISTVPSKSLRHMQDFGLHSLDIKTCDLRWSGGNRYCVLTEVVWVDPEAGSAGDAHSEEEDWEDWEDFASILALDAEAELLSRHLYQELETDWQATVEEINCDNEWDWEDLSKCEPHLDIKSEILR